MSARYLTEARVADMAARLSPTDERIIATLDRVRLATATQLERLHFRGREGSRRTEARRARRTLARLTEQRVIVRLDRRIGGARAGSAGYVYALDVAGQRLASASGPAGGVRLRRPWTPGLAFVAHTLAVTELYVWLYEAKRQGELELVAFDAEPHCWRAFAGVGGGRCWLKPDAFVQVGVDASEHFAFVEVDRATQSAPALARKLASYRRYFQSGREQARLGGLFPRVLLLVPSRARQEVVARICAAQPRASRPLWLVANYEDALAAFSGEEA